MANILIIEDNNDIHELLKEAGIRENFDAQGSNVKEINEALKTASKKGTGNSGFPEYVGIVKDFLIIIEDKPGLSKHINYTDDDLIADDIKSNTDYAVNGAVFYAKHLADKVSLKKIIAVGISGNEKKHRITPVFVNERGEYFELADIETLISFSIDNIDEYYVKEILQEETNFEKETAEILKDAATLHNDLRNYGNIEEKNKPLIVSGILLALRETEHGNFSLESLTGDTVKTDGSKIYTAIKSNLQRANVSPEVKKDKLLSQFAIIRDDVKINEKNANLGNLTPKHITELFCDLVDLKPTDKVFDPTCGTAGFLIAAMHDMLTKAESDYQREQIRKHQLFGIEEQSYMFTIATTNMILRGDGKSNLENQDFLRQNPSKLQLKQCNVGMMNPPYSMGSKTNTELYEINFTEHLLNSLVEGAKTVVIVPQSTFTGKTKFEKEAKQNILKHHTLEGVITLNKNTFYGVGTNPCIAVFTAGIPHRPEKECKFINFENDGFEVSKHIGLVETATAKDKKQHLLDVWFDRTEAETKFCVQTTIEADDEWLHSFYYFNDEIPSEEDFQKTIADYLTFEVNMITHGRGYLFGIEEQENYQEISDIEEFPMAAEKGDEYE